MPSFEEWIDRNLDPASKQVAPLVRRFIASWQAVGKAQQAGDLSTSVAQLSQLVTIGKELAPLIEQMILIVREYDLRIYLENQFDAEFRQECKNENLPLEGQFPRYLISPLLVQVSLDRGGILINQRLYRGFRPARLVDIIKAERTRIVNRPFNSRYFLNDLAAAYDGLVELETAKNGVNMAGHEISLRDVYQRLVPMRQWKVNYPISFFAYDLHRLFRTAEVTAPDGRRLYLAPAHQARLNLTILDAAGRETQLGLIAFRRT